MFSEITLDNTNVEHRITPDKKFKLLFPTVYSQLKRIFSVAE